MEESQGGTRKLDVTNANILHQGSLLLDMIKGMKSKSRAQEDLTKQI